MRRFISTCFFSLICCLFVMCPARIAAAEKPKPSTDQQLPRDPHNTYGKFENGMKYIIRKNANPPGKVSIYLHIKTGALNETDRQNGLAHFIEHMAFNGSEHFKPGELVPLLNKMGMSFGADTNAHTNLQETVYKLTMPNTKPETIDIALTIFSDYAGGLSMLPDEINSERGVILEETRARKSVGQRLHKKVTKELFGDTRLAIHDVIGDEEQIKTFPQAEFLDYWNTWYRPEKMTLIAVGDIDPEDMIKRATEKLAKLKARASSREDLKAGLKPFTASRALIFTDPEQVAGEVELVTLKPGRLPMTTRSQYRRETLEGVSEWVVNRRFADMIRKGGAPFRQAGISTGNYLNEAMTVGASASGQPADWNKMLDATIAEITRAVDHGFTERELELAKRGMLAGAERAIKTESTRDSKAIVNGLSGAVGQDRPILSAEQRLELLKEILADINTDELHKVFVDNFKTKNYVYLLTLPASDAVKLPSADDILSAASAAWMKKTEAPEDAKLAESVLPSQPDPGKVISRETDKDLGVTDVTFANGVVMHHKFSDYKKDQVSVHLTMPGGAIEETHENKGVSEVASLIISRSATSRFTSSQIRDLLVGKNIAVGGGIGLDTMSLSVSGSPKDLPLGMQLLYAILTDGVLEQSALDDWKKLEHQALERRKTSAQAHLQEAMAASVYGGDVRLSPLTAEVVDRQQRPAAEAWFKRIADNAAIEVAVVGDLQLDEATELVSRYVGSLPKRTGKFEALNKLRKLDRTSGPYSETVHFAGQTPKAVVLAGFIGCDARDPERRPLTLAGLVITDRMIKRIREKEQLVYSIGCQSTPSVAIPATGLFSASAPTDPHNAEKLAKTIIDMLNEFAEGGPTEDELATAKKQIANRLESQMKEPGFWLSQLDDMIYRGRSLTELKEIPEIYQTFTIQQVRDVVRKFAKDDRLVQIAVIPDTSEKSSPATTRTAVRAKTEK
jgi:zinc protease